MTILDQFRGRWQLPASHYTYRWINPDNVEINGKKPVPAQIISGEKYFRIWLAEMFLKNDRAWGTAWYPAVLCSIKLKFGNKTQEITHVAGESALKNLDLKRVNINVSMNHEITTLLPFNGGTIALEAALIAMQGKNDVKSLLKVLGEFSKLLVVPQLSSVIAVAAPLSDGIAELVGASDQQPELRLQDQWTGTGVPDGNILRSGYFTVISAKDGEIKPEELHVKDHQLFRGAARLTGYHYMLFRVDVIDERDDWDSLTNIGEPYGQALAMLSDARNADDPELGAKMRKEAEKRYNAARLAAFRAPELTTVVGKNQVLDALDRRWKEAAKQLAGAGAVADDFPRTLQAAMRNPLSPEQARDRGETREQELWN
jgi:hypothetical protein